MHLRQRTTHPLALCAARRTAHAVRGDSPAVARVRRRAGHGLLAAGDCAIVTDDGAGSSSFTLVSSPTVVANDCGFDVPPLTVTFPQGTSVTSSIATTNLADFPDGGG